MTCRYFRNQRNMFARQLTKRFVEQRPHASGEQIKEFETLARGFYRSRSDVDAEVLLKDLKEFYDRVENSPPATET